MSRGRIAAAVAAVLVLVIGWYAVLLAPRGKQLKDEKAKVEAARGEQRNLEVTLKRLQGISANRAARQAELARLASAVPPQPDLAGFIISADKIAVDAGVNWVSVSPSPPVAGTGATPSTITMTIQVEGGFFQVLDYLNRLEHLERVVVVDSVQLTATGGGVSPALTVNLGARMFTTAAAARSGPGAGTGGATGTGGTTGAGGGAGTATTSSTGPTTGSTFSTPTTRAGG